MSLEPSALRAFKKVLRSLSPKSKDELCKSMRSVEEDLAQDSERSLGSADWFATKRSVDELTILSRMAGIVCPKTSRRRGKPSKRIEYVS